MAGRRASRRSDGDLSLQLALALKEIIKHRSALLVHYGYSMKVDPPASGKIESPARRIETQFTMDAQPSVSVEHSQYVMTVPFVRMKAPEPLNPVGAATLFAR